VSNLMVRVRAAPHRMRGEGGLTGQGYHTFFEASASATAVRISATENGLLMTS
jgi:hypothetical protein